MDVATLAGLDHAEFALRVEADRSVAVDRTVTWDTRAYGAHAESGVAAPAQQWLLAEGATHSGFDLFYLIENPASAPATVRVSFLRPGGQPALEREYVVAPHARETIWVNTVDPQLASTDVSAVVSTTAAGGIVVERAMYLTRGQEVFGAGHAAAGVVSPASRWLLAEGATGPYFDLFVLVANPAASAVTVDLRYYLPDGRTLERSRTIPAGSRDTVWVDHEAPELADTAVSVVVESRQAAPIVVERAMWWPGSSTSWHEAHASVASTGDGLLWALAEGEVDAAGEKSTYVLIANVSPWPGRARLTFRAEDGTQAVTERDLPPLSRTNVDVGAEVPAMAGRRFGTLVESLGTTPAALVVERAMYWDAGGERWAAGTSATATRPR
jgi:hypothetical protein